LIAKFNSVAQASGLWKKGQRKHRLEACATVKAFAHITGGGFVDKIPRVLPKNLDVVIRKGSWNMLPIFRIIEAKGGVPDAELYQVFNMGIGMVAIMSADKADAILKFIRGQKHKAWLIGEVVKGKGGTRVI